MSIGKIFLLIFAIILLLWLLSIPLMKFIAHISNIIELKKTYGSKESFKYIAFLIFQGILTLIGIIALGYLIRFIF